MVLIFILTWIIKTNIIDLNRTYSDYKNLKIIIILIFWTIYFENSENKTKSRFLYDYEWKALKPSWKETIFIWPNKEKFQRFGKNDCFLLNGRFF